METIGDDDVHHREGECAIGTGIDGQIPVGTGGGASAVGIDDDQLCAFAARLHNVGPEMDVVAVNVRSPRDDVARMDELIRLGAELDAEYGFDAGLAGGRTDGAFEFRSSEATEKAAIHGTAIEGTQSSAIGIRQNSFAAEFSDDAVEAVSDFVQGFVP